MGERLDDIAAKSIHLKTRPDPNNAGLIKELFKVDGIDLFVMRDRLYLNPSLILGGTGTYGGTISSAAVNTRTLNVTGNAIIQGDLSINNLSVSTLLKAERAEITNLVGTNIYGNGSNISQLGSLNTHSDVDMVTDLPGLGSVLTWDTAVGKWVPAVPNLSRTSIGDLRNVDITTTTPTIGQSLIWDGGSFVPGRNTLLTVSDHSDVDTTTIRPVNGDALLWNGANWVPGSTVLTNTDKSVGDLTDTDVLSTPPANGDALVWNGTSSVWEPGVAFTMGSIDTHTDVDTSTTPPVVGELLRFNGLSFVPTTGSLYVSDSGAVGIGTNAPTESLDVVGTIKLSGTVNAASDRRLKTNIVPLTNSLHIIEQLQGVKFNMKVGDEDEKMVGVIAQDVEKVLPEVVRKFEVTTGEEGSEKTEMTYAVQYQNIVAPLIEAVKELSEKVKVLEAKLRN